MDTKKCPHKMSGVTILVVETKKYTRIIHTQTHETMRTRFCRMTCITLVLQLMAGL